MSHLQALGWLASNTPLLERPWDETSSEALTALAYVEMLDEHAEEVTEEQLASIAAWLTVSDAALAERFADLFQSTLSWPQHNLILPLVQEPGGSKLGLALLKQACLRSARRSGTYEQVVSEFSPRFANFKEGGLGDVLSSEGWEEASLPELELLAAVCGLELYCFSGADRFRYTTEQVVYIAQKLSLLREQVVDQGGDVLFMFSRNLSWAVSTLYAEPVGWYLSRYGDKVQSPPLAAA